MDNPVHFLKTPVAIVGMGMSGESIQRLLAKCGLKGKNLVPFDAKAGAAEYSDPEKMLQERAPRTLVVSPGVPLASDWIQDFRLHGGDITSELSIALQFLTKERLLCVTGAVGKSTTVSLLEAGLQGFAPTSFVGGNLGRPLADYVTELQVGKRAMAPWVVLELSSFQLENIEPLRCEASAITYLTPNHLERYENLEHYYRTKWTLAERTEKFVVLNSNGGDLRNFAKGRKVSASILWTDQNDEELTPFHLDRAKLLGSHNQDNLAIAAKLARELGWPLEAIERMREFPGLPHRLENLGEFSGIRFVNDSKATTMESVKTAAFGLYEQMDRKKQLVLLLGGKDKNLPWQELGALKKIQKLRCIFFGAVAERARDISGLPGEVFPKLAPAMASIKSIATGGDTVLLSPGGTSLDEFKNFEDRGRVFGDLVRKNFA